MTNLATSSACIGAACALLLTAAGAPVRAQALQEQLTFVAQGAAPKGQSRSAYVSYADLDLTTEAGQTELRQRLRRTEAELCREVDDTHSAAALTCEDDARRNAARFERAAIAQATAQSVLAQTREQPGR
jgi:UrcA family protein